MAISAGTARFRPTEAQAEAISSIALPMAVDAAAGSGKTAVLIRRILTIVGCDPEKPGSGDWSRLEQILAITFTDKAAGELRAKLRAFVPAAERFRLDQAWISTFHGFCSRLLRRFGPARGLDPSFVLLDENAAAMLSRSCSRETLLALLEEKDEAAAMLVEEVGYAAAIGALEELMQFRWHARTALADRADAEPWEQAVLAALAAVFAEVTRSHALRLAELGALDFQELEIRALGLLEERPIVSACRQMFGHLLVDEFQDTNDLQTELVLKLFDPALNRLFIVGDEAQSIYRFRGANVSCFGRVRSEISRRGGRHVRLAHNFRSRRSIVEFVNSSLTVLAPGLFADPSEPRPMTAVLPDDAKAPAVVELSIPATEETNVAALREREAAAIAEMIEARAASGEWSCGEVVLLFRSMTAAEIYEAALRRCCIPCSSSGGRGFLERREVTDLLAATRYAHDPDDAVALLTLLRSPIAGLTDDEIAIMAGPDGRGIPAAVATDDRLALVRELPALAAHMRPSEILRRVINESGLEFFWYQLDPSGAAFRNIDRLVTLARDLEREMPTTLADFCAFMAEMRERGARLGDSSSGTGSGQAVRLMTVHAAKGLEFPVVFLPDLIRIAPGKRNAWIFARGDADGGSGVAFKKRNPDQPFGARIKTPRFTQLVDDEVRREGLESRRLLYVAMTRAIRTLVLPIHEGAAPKETWHTWVSATLSEGGGRKIAARVTPAWTRATAAQGRATPKIDAPSPLARRSGHGMLLSVSALDSYSICPMQYYLKYVLGLPASELVRNDEVRLAPNVRGSIVHAMLSAATDDRDRLRAIARSEALASGIDVRDKELDELVNEAGKALELAGRERISRGFRELPFELAAEGSLISGTIDWLVPVDQGYEVVDFKTGIADSRKLAARGEQYEVQMQAYAIAAEAITANEVVATNLVFPSAGTTLRRTMDEARRSEARRNIAGIVAGIEACDYAVPAAPPCEGCIFHRNAMCWEDRIQRAKGKGQKAKGKKSKKA